MAHSAETNNLKLSHFSETDRPSWIQDYNQDMERIDKAFVPGQAQPTVYNAQKLAGYDINTGTDPRNKVLTCHSNGCVEVGQIVDFHKNGANEDSDFRLLNDQKGHLIAEGELHVNGSLGTGGRLNLPNGYISSTHQALYIAASWEPFKDWDPRLFYGTRVMPGTDNWRWTLCPNGKDNATVSLGMPNYRWQDIYSVNGPSTVSDEKQKKDIADLEEDFVVGMVENLRPVQYRFISGESGRLHIGFIAQEVEKLLEKLGKTGIDFAGFIKSPVMEEYTETEEYTDTETVMETGENGEEVEKTIEVAKTREVTKSKASETEFIYGLRYEEFIALLYRYNQIKETQRKEQQQELVVLKEELQALRGALEKSDLL